jgi:hypothetical protein
MPAFKLNTSNWFHCLLAPIWVLYVWRRPKKGGQLHKNSQKTVIFIDIFVLRFCPDIYILLKPALRAHIFKE